MIFLAGSGEKPVDIAVVADFEEVASDDVFDVGVKPFDRAWIVDALGNQGVPMVCWWVLFGVSHSCIDLVLGGDTIAQFHNLFTYILEAIHYLITGKFNYPQPMFF